MSPNRWQCGSTRPLGVTCACTLTSALALLYQCILQPLLVTELYCCPEVPLNSKAVATAQKKTPRQVEERARGGVWSYPGGRIILKNSPGKAACSGVQGTHPSDSIHQSTGLFPHSPGDTETSAEGIFRGTFSPSAVTGTQELQAAPAHGDLAFSNALGALENEN